LLRGGTPLDTHVRVTTDITAPRVLVADDQSDVIAALRLLLRGEGITVDPATSVQEVRDRLSAAPYDLLLMDLNYERDTTSGREGLDLLAEVHARDRLLPVVVMTGWSSIDTAVEAMRRGARAYVSKPWDNAALAAVVQREIEDGRADREVDARTTRERDDAKAVQRALLPSALPALPGCDLAARWEPASTFGGDCYDALRLTDTRFALSIADVCGKGLPAALLMANLQASVRAFASPTSRPQDVVTSINHALCRHMKLGRFVTFFYSVYDVESRVLRYTNAGHNPPILFRSDGTVVRLTASGIVAGIYEEAAYETGETRLDPGDRLVLFTDGITEARSAEGLELGDEGMIDVLTAAPDVDAGGLVTRIFEHVHAFANGPLEDDATAVVLRVADRTSRS
jgi:sigma-B regulation protein RsbU (phosphoserine phosphatase)